MEGRYRYSMLPSLFVILSFFHCVKPEENFRLYLQNQINCIEKQVASVFDIEYRGLFQSNRSDFAKELLFAEPLDLLKNASNSVLEMEPKVLNTTNANLTKCKTEVLKKIDTEIKDKNKSVETYLEGIVTDTNIGRKEQNLKTRIGESLAKSFKEAEHELNTLWTTASEAPTPNIQPPIAFFALLTTNCNTSGFIQFDHLVTNIGSGYNIEKGTFTAPKEGVYMISSSFLVNGGFANVHIIKNGIETVRGYAAKDRNEGSGFMNVILRLDKDDQVGVRLIPDHFTGYLRGDFYSSLSGVMIDK